MKREMQKHFSITINFSLSMCRLLYKGEKLFLVSWSLEVQSRNWSHLIRSGVGLASLSSPSIVGEEGRPREPDGQLSSFSTSSVIFCHCHWWRSFTSLRKYVQVVDSWSNCLFLSLIFNLLSKVLPNFTSSQCWDKKYDLDISMITVSSVSSTFCTLGLMLLIWNVINVKQFKKSKSPLSSGSFSQ